MQDARPKTLEGVVLYNEHTENLWPNKQTSIGVTELGARMLSPSSPKLKHAAIEQELARIGFDGFEYAQMGYANGGFYALSLLTSHVPYGWPEVYCKQHLWDVDTRLSLSLARSLPTVWSVQDQMTQEQHKSQPSARVTQFLKALLDVEIHSGMTLIMPVAQSERTTVMHWLSRQPNLNLTGNKRMLSEGLIMGLGVHECLTHLRPLSGAGTVAPKHLTQQQNCVIKCLTQGMSDKAIAHALSLSTHTVDYHLRVLRSKFNVHNRIQLVNVIGTMHFSPY
jgi:DNA-binding CsgD family transcriptional regulator